MLKPDVAMLDRLVEFAAVELESGDIEPWAALLTDLHAHDELTLAEAHWAIKLYNAYDTFEAAFGVMARWPTPTAWLDAADRADAARFQCTQERRNLRGGKVIRHLEHYVECLAGMEPEPWMRQAILGDHPGRDFDRLTSWLRQVWGVGRQTAFEWAEFAMKVRNLPIDADNAQLWESEGPRRSLQKLYGNPEPDARWLDDAAHACREYLSANGVKLSWVDFETVVCDFNVMRDGRYYPGRHLAALREEIDGMPEPYRAKLERSWSRVIPARWAGIAPGIDQDKKPVFARTGKIIDEP